MKKSVGITVVGGLAAVTIIGTGVMIMKNRPVTANAETDIVADVGEIMEASAAATEAGPQVLDVKAAQENAEASDTASTGSTVSSGTKEVSQTPEDTEAAPDQAPEQEKDTQEKGKTQKEQTGKDEPAGEKQAEEPGGGEKTESVKEQDTETEGDSHSPEEEKINAYLGDSVLIGDSIVLGYRNYCRKSEDMALRDIDFLAAGSFSAHNALWPVSEKSVHPVFQGQQRPIWESISMMDVGNVFLCFEHR